MYASGIPVGLLVDAKGPRLGVLGGSVALGVGYYPLYQGGSYQPVTDTLLNNTSVQWRSWFDGYGLAVFVLLLDRCWGMCSICRLSQDMYETRRICRMFTD